MVLDDVEHADSFLQCPAPELMADRKAVLVTRAQIRPQCGDVLSVKLVCIGHIETPR